MITVHFGTIIRNQSLEIQSVAQVLKLLKLLAPTILGVFCIGLIAETVKEQPGTSVSIDKSHLLVQPSANTIIEFNWKSSCPINDPFGTGYSAYDNSCVGVNLPHVRRQKKNCCCWASWECG